MLCNLKIETHCINIKIDDDFINDILKKDVNSILTNHSILKCADNNKNIKNEFEIIGNKNYIKNNNNNRIRTRSAHNNNLEYKNKL